MTAGATSEHIARVSNAEAQRVFDGVICFGGEDWWYHNRGHYDMQMMREASREMPVLYINSLGMRTPRPGEGRMFFKRVLRKLRSLRRGFTQVRDNFAVVSPFAIPGSMGMRISKRLLPGQIRRAARRAGIRRPLIWVACPPGAEVVEQLDPVGLVYQRTDRFEDYTNVDRARIIAYDHWLKESAGLTLFCSRLLYDNEHESCAQSAYIDHGADVERFEAAGREGAEPPDVAPIARPRAGFVGGIDASTFDPPLFVEVANSLPDIQFVLVGGCTLPEGWADLPNVHLLGQRSYDEVASYMASCDVLLMPWNRSEWIQACNPIKLKEYLAIGRPIVSTSFPELSRYEGLVRVADGAEAFAQSIRDALAEPFDPAPGRRRVHSHTWDAKFHDVLDRLREHGVICDARMNDA